MKVLEKFLKNGVSIYFAFEPILAIDYFHSTDRPRLLHRQTALFFHILPIFFYPTNPHSIDHKIFSLKFVVNPKSYYSLYRKNLIKSSKLMVLTRVGG